MNPLHPLLVALGGVVLPIAAHAVVVSTDLAGHLAEPGVSANGIYHDGVGHLYIPETRLGYSISGGGTLLWTGRHILTAAHCVADANGSFWTSPGSLYFDTASGAKVYTVSSAVYHPLYTDDLYDGYDIAILTLSETVDASIPRYDIFTGDPIGLDFTFFGYGLVGTGDTGGVVNDNYKYWGMNTIETYADGGIEGEYRNKWTMLGYDFDDGTSARDGFGFYDTDVEETHLGLGYYEAMGCYGDSGSGAFVEDPDNPGNYLLVGVMSLIGRGEGDPNSDIDEEYNASFGEYGILANVPGFSNWIIANVPEPSDYAMIFGGLALVAAILRRRRS